MVSKLEETQNYLSKEVQFKRKNPIYLGFSIAYFFLLLVIATGAYSMSGEFLFKMAVLAAQYDMLVPLVDNFGIAPFFLLYAIVPIVFLLIRLSSKISIEMTENNIVFRLYYFFPIETFKIDISEIESVSYLRIKPGEHKVEFFSKRAFTYKKILFVSGRSALKLASNLIKKDTIVMGTQKPKEWIETFRARNIIIKDETVMEVTPVPKVEKGKVKSSQSV